MAGHGNLPDFLLMAAVGYDMFFDEEEDDPCDELLLEIDERENHSKNENYFEETVATYSLSDFQSHFRLTRYTFEELSRLLAPQLLTPQSILPVEKKLALALWTFGNQEVYRSIADRFGVSKSTAWQCMLEVANALCTRSREFIKWPTGEEITRNKEEFIEMAGYPGVIGVADGTHIAISAPNEHPESYFNRKGYYSINTLGICDSRRFFTYVYAASCGSVHDARVWDVCDLQEQIENHYDQYFPEETHIIGDSAYTLRRHVITPYRNNGHLEPHERHHNKVHSKTRQTIERTFALLIGRFRRLRYLYVQNVKYASMIILASCCLHNICLSLDDILEIENDLPIHINGDMQNNDGDYDDHDNEVNVPFDAQIKRNEIANAMYDNGHN